MTLTATTELTTFDGAPVRVWRGTTGKGVGIIAYVRAVRVVAGADEAELVAELQSISAPTENHRHSFDVPAHA